MPTTVYEVPLAGGRQKFKMSVGGVTYTWRFFYTAVPLESWSFDVSDADDVPLACGRPLVTGCDLLEQLRHLGIPGSLFVRTDGDPDAVPTYGGLGTTSHLYLELTT